MVFLLVATVGCEKSELYQENVDQKMVPSILEMSKKDNDCYDRKMVPLKGKIIEIADLSVPMIFCGPVPYPSRFLDIKGNLTHFGNVAGGAAYMLDCNFVIIDGIPHFMVNTDGEFATANNERVFYNGSLWFQIENPTVGGSQFYIYGGTGKWEDAKGCFDGLVKRLDELTISFVVDGMITSPGLIK